MSESFWRVWEGSLLVRAVIGFLASSVTLAVLGAAALAGFFDGFDAEVREAAQRTAAPPLTYLFGHVTVFGSTIVLTVVGSVAIVIFALMKWAREIWLFLLTMGGQIVLHHGFKALIARDRPEPLLNYTVGDSYSFPSGHALASLSVYGMLAWLITSRSGSPGQNFAIWVLVSFLVLAIGFSRVYFGVHAASDVLAGYLAALIWISAVVSGRTARAPVKPPDIG